MKGVEVTSLADTDAERLKEVAETFNVKKVFRDYRHLLEDPSLDIAAICTPPLTHADIASAAVRAGKHVFIEKPVALCLEDCDRLLDQAAGTPVKITVGFKLRYHRLVRDAARLIDQGVLGPTVSIRYVATGGHGASEPEWLRNRASGGGVLVEYGVHAFDLWRHLLRCEVEEVFAFGEKGVWEDERASISARMTNGAVATAVLARGTAENHEFELYGQGGRLVVSRFLADGLAYQPLGSYPGSLGVRMRNVFRTACSLPGILSSYARGGEHMECYREQWRYFLDAVRNDTPVHATLEDGRQALQATLAALQAATSGSSVLLEHGITAQGLAPRLGP
jgi:predicted dehydrogenase